MEVAITWTDYHRGRLTSRADLTTSMNNASGIRLRFASQLFG